MTKRISFRGEPVAGSNPSCRWTAQPRQSFRTNVRLLTSIDKRGIICCMDRISVSVPTELIQDLRRRPEAYGVAELRSEAARLQKLLQVGAQTSLRRVEEAAMVATYREWSGDKERREAVVTLADTLLAEGGFADGLLRGQQRQRG